MGHLVPVKMGNQPDPKTYPGEIPKHDGKIKTSPKFQAELKVSNFQKC